MRAAPGDDHGSASVWTLLLGGVVVAVTVVALLVAAAVAERHRAGAAADLAALAAARSATAGSGVACAAARATAEVNEARLTACTVRGGVVEVAVAVRGGGMLRHLSGAQGRARAGPLVDMPGLPGTGHTQRNGT